VTSLDSLSRGLVSFSLFLGLAGGLAELLPKVFWETCLALAINDGCSGDLWRDTDNRRDFGAGEYIFHSLGFSLVVGLHTMCMSLCTVFLRAMGWCSACGGEGTGVEGRGRFGGV
jgi:hypothetical protein